MEASTEATALCKAHDQAGGHTPPHEDFNAADAHLPLSSSSAMPPHLCEAVGDAAASAPNIPRLKARVHRRLTAAEFSRISLDSIQFRPLQEGDLDEMVALHTEWFPVSYDEGFYTKSVQGELITLVATHSSESSSSSTCQGDTRPQECLLGMITMSTNCEHHKEDIMHVMGADCATLCQPSCSSTCCGNGDTLPRTSADVQCDSGGGPPKGSLAYILTLGVVDGYRRRGLARELLERSMWHVDRTMPHVQAVYLHVVTYNEAAIQLYENIKFLRIGHFNSFYFLHGRPYDSYLYARYCHGGRPSWKWRVRNWFGVGLNLSWREWVFSAFSSLWRGEASALVDKSDKPEMPDMP